MTLSLSTFSRNAILNTLIQRIDSGELLSRGYLEIRTLPKPSSPDLAATGTLLVTADLSNPSFQPVTNGTSLAYEITPRDVISNDGTASWFRIYNRDNIPVLDGIISDADGEGDIMFNSVDFSNGGKIAFASFRITAPSSC